MAMRNPESVHPFTGEDLSTYRKDGNVLYNQKEFELSSLLGRAEAVVVVMATGYGHHKYVGLRDKAKNFNLINPVNDGLLPIVVTSTKPDKVGEDRYNGDLVHIPGAIPALKVEQVTVPQENKIEDLVARWNYYRGVLEAETVRRSEAFGYGGSVLKDVGSNGLVVVAGSDVTVYREDPNSGKMEALFQPGEKMDKNDVRNRLVVPGYQSPLKFRAQIDLAVRTLMIQGVPVNVGVASRRESFFWINPLSDTEFDAYWDGSDKELLRRVNGGLTFADSYLNQRIFHIQNDQPEWDGEDDQLERQELGLRLRSNTPYLLNMVGELIRCASLPLSCNDGTAATIRSGVSCYFPKGWSGVVADWSIINSARDFLVPKS